MCTGEKENYFFLIVIALRTFLRKVKHILTTHLSVTKPSTDQDLCGDRAVEFFEMTSLFCDLKNIIS